MDLSDLHHSLALPAVRTGAPPRPAPASDSDDDGDDGAVGVVTEIFNRHRKSTQAESKQVCVVLAAVLEVIKAEGLQPTPTALFAALLASLAKPEALASAEVTAAMCTILAPVAARVPSGVLRARFAPASQQVAAILEAHGADAVVARAALPCLCQVLEGLNPADWASAARPFALVLAACLDSRPKLRKRAQAGLAGVLGAVQAAPAALDPASEAVLKLCQRVLPGPEAAAHAAAAAPSKKRADAEAGITRAVTDALHLMGALKQCMALLSGPAASAVCALVLQLYPLRQPLLTRHATDTLAALCAAPASRLPPKALAEVLKAVLAGEASWDRKDAGAALGTTALLEAGLLRLVAADAGAAAALLPRAVHALVPQLASEHEGVRQGTAAALRGLLAACVGPDAVAAAVAAAGGGGRTPSAVARVVSAVEASLGAQYRDAWEACLPVATELMQRLGREGAPLAGGLVDRVGQLCAGGEDAAEDGEGGGDARLAGAAQAALGAALRSLGPEAVLQVLPLNIREGVEGRGEARAWLLPLLRAHVRGGELAYWGAELLPLARWLGARAAAAGRDPARRREAAVCSTLEAQVWALLPSFCSWALDLDEALP
jgi:ribosomal RNA-processing protein 12